MNTMLLLGNDSRLKHGQWNQNMLRQPHSNTATGLSPTSGVFVGRQREMADLNAALEETISSQGRLVVLVGEPGIGKTRTAQELAAQAEKLGAQVLWGWCYYGSGRAVL